MIFLFYNKLLLRLLVGLIGAGIGLAAYEYITLSARKLPEHGAMDALAIVGFLIAGWLAMLAAEVLDNHYARVFGCLCVGLGALVSYPWIFKLDGPALVALPDAQQSFYLLHMGFMAAVGLTAILFLILVTRLIMDRVSYGRRPVAAAKLDIGLGASPAGLGQPAREPDLAPIPVDASPLNVTAGPGVTSAPVAAPARQPSPVRRLTGIGGMYLGSQFELSPGEVTIGRQGTQVLLEDDNQVSRTHAIIRVADDGIAEVRDNSSTNGTYLNNQRIDSSVLCPGDVLRVGTTLFKVEA
jgi:hypothetical protein